MTVSVSVVSLITFVTCTIGYFNWLKPTLTVKILNNPDQLLEYKNNTFIRLAIYLLTVIISQFGVNIWYLILHCGGDIQQNIWAAALYTFIPWIFIFAIMVAIIVVFPGLKLAFTDVIGYYAVATQANEILSSIIMKPEVTDALLKNTTDAEKSTMSKTAQAVMKIWGNNSLLINQMNPDNFLDIWNLLKPLMIKETDEGNILTKAQETLLNLVVLKDNIGEGLWYIYTAILISSIVNYNLTSRGCKKSVETIKAQHDAYILKREADNKATNPKPPI